MNTTKSLFVCVLALITFYSHAQSDYTYNKQPTYIDALSLEKIHEQNSTASPEESIELEQEFYDILKRYGIDSSSIEGNPFLTKYKFELITTPSPLADKSDKWAGNTIEKVEDKVIPSGSVPMNWEAATINGIANFMAGRFKQEVLHMGINQMFKQITERDSLLLTGLFPKTFAHILALREQGTDAYYTADLLH